MVATKVEMARRLQLAQEMTPDCVLMDAVGLAAVVLFTVRVSKSARSLGSTSSLESSS